MFSPGNTVWVRIRPKPKRRTFCPVLRPSSSQDSVPGRYLNSRESSCASGCLELCMDTIPESGFQACQSARSTFWPFSPRKTSREAILVGTSPLGRTAHAANPWASRRSAQVGARQKPAVFPPGYSGLDQNPEPRGRSSRVLVFRFTRRGASNVKGRHPGPPSIDTLTVAVAVMGIERFYFCRARVQRNPLTHADQSTLSPDFSLS